MAALADAMGTAQDLSEAAAAVCKVVKELLGCGEVHMFVSKTRASTKHSSWEHACTDGQAFIAKFAEYAASDNVVINEMRRDNASWPINFNSLLAVPIFAAADAAPGVGVLVCANKDGSVNGFRSKDERDIQVMIEHCKGTILMARSLACAQRECNKREAMIALIKTIRSIRDGNDINVLVDSLVTTASTLVEADRVMLSVVDDVEQKLICRSSVDGLALKLPIGQGIAGHVAGTGKTLNIVNAYEDPRFDQSMDTDTGYHTKSVLCVPIIDQARGGGSGTAPKVVAVLQCVNSTNGQFTSEDEAALLEVSANLQGLQRRKDTHQRGVLQQLQSAARLQTVDDSTQEMLSNLYAFSPPRSPALFSPKKQEQTILKARTKALWSKFRVKAKVVGKLRVTMSQSTIDWSYAVLERTPDELVVGARTMLKEFGLIEIFSLPSEELDTFITTIKDNYLANQYHNFQHGVSVMHLVFMVLKTGEKARSLLDPIHLLSALLAGLCHDVGHRGMNNGFEAYMETDLALRHVPSFLPIFLPTPPSFFLPSFIFLPSFLPLLYDFFPTLLPL
jgi:GAF domain-containing protein